jgi:hypothetical protein
MINKTSQRTQLVAKFLEEGNIPLKLSQLIEAKDIMSIKGTLGNKEGGDPIEYEEVRIRADEKETTFEIYNKGMSMFINETNELKRVFEFCVRLQRELRLR